MIIRELSTLLNFKVDPRGANQFDRKLDALANRATQFAAGIGAALAGAFGIDQIIKAGDAYTTSMNRLGASTATAEEAAQAYEGLYESARSTGIAVEESSRAFMRFQPAMQKAGFGIQDTIGLVDGLQKGLLAAGATAAESSSVFQQLGQAINSGVLQGEELNALLENASPTIVQAFADSLSIAREELKEMASEGKLVAKNVLPALVAAAKAGRDEFGKMRVTTELAMARSRVAMDRFFAELDRGIRFTEGLANAIEAAGRKLDEWRRYIPTISRAVDELGGLERILGAVAIGTAAVTTAVLALNGALLTMVTRILLVPGLIAGAVAIAGLLLQDLYYYFKNDGTKTLFGEWLGPVDELIGPIKPALDGLKDSLDDVAKILTGTPDEAIRAWDRLRQRIQTLFDGITDSWPDWAKTGMRVIAQGDREMGRFTGDLVTGAREGAADGSILSRMGDAIVADLRRALGALGFRQQVEGPDGKLRLLQPGEQMNDALMRRPASTTNTVTVTQTNTIPVEVNVTATGTSGAEVAGAAERGVRQGVGTVNLDADRLAREVRMAIPGIEGAGGTAGAVQVRGWPSQ